MTKRFFAVLLSSLLAVSAAFAVTGDDLLGGLPAPPNGQMLATKDLASGGQLAHYMTPANPIAVIDSYAQVLPTSGWTVTSSGGGDSAEGGNAGLQAINGPRYLSINAGGPVGTTYVSVCVWPSKPDRDHCSIDN
jgi:hypothetical protein